MKDRGEKASYGFTRRSGLCFLPLDFIKGQFYAVAAPLPAKSLRLQIFCGNPEKNLFTQKVLTLVEVKRPVKTAPKIRHRQGFGVCLSSSHKIFAFANLLREPKIKGGYEVAGFQKEKSSAKALLFSFCYVRLCSLNR